MPETFRPSPAPRHLGASGIEVSPIAWGMWRFGLSTPADAQVLIEAALAVGITLFDTADIYGHPNFGAAEALLGRVLRAAPTLRARMTIATKGGILPPIPYDSSPAYLGAALDASLRRLGLEQIDLYQIHRPDILAHPQEVARALEEMIASGKVRAVGVSNYTVAQTGALAAFLPVPIASLQPEFSPLTLAPITDGLLDLAMARDIAVLAWSPLAGGRIAAPEGERAVAVAAALDRVAMAYDVSRAAAAYSWIMVHPARPIPILGTQTPARIAAMTDAFDCGWTRQTWYDVLVAARGEKLP